MTDFQLTKHTSPAEKLNDQKGEKERAECRMERDHIWKGRRAELKKGKACALLRVRGGDGEDAFRGRIRTAGVHKEADRPYT